MTRVKICGLTSVEDARLVVEAGASAVGMIFWPDSPRGVSVAQAREIARVIPPFVQRVGVFVNATPDEAQEVASAVGLDALQLHGDEEPDAWAAVRWPLVKALTLSTYAGSGWLTRARAILLDAHDPVRRGGTGQRIDWAAARHLAGDRPFVLAGGITPDNVEAAIAQAAPSAIDVASGVESAPGRKDPARVAALFAAVRRADSHRRVEACVAEDNS